MATALTALINYVDADETYENEPTYFIAMDPDNDYVYRVSDLKVTFFNPDGFYSPGEHTTPRYKEFEDFKATLATAIAAGNTQFTIPPYYLGAFVNRFAV